MKAKFTKDGRTFECVASEANVVHLQRAGWVRVADTITKTAEPEPATAVAESEPDKPRRGRPPKAE